MDEKYNTIDVVPPSVLIVILNWNGWKDTLSSVESVLKQNYSNFQVLVIDNCSTNESVERLKFIRDDRVELLELAKNLGAAGGRNEGFRRALDAGFQYVWLLDNDAVADDRDTLWSLVALAETDQKIGLVMPRIAVLDAEERLTYCGGVCSVSPAIYDETHDPEIARRWVLQYPNAGVTLGTATLVKSSLIREIGMLDEEMFTYFEDIDYSLRSSLAGYRNLVDENSRVKHKETNKDNNPLAIKPHHWYYWARNECLFWRKHLGAIRALQKSWWTFHGMLRHLNRCKENQDACQAILAGLWHSWIKRGGPYRPEYRMPRILAAAVWKYAQTKSGS